MSDAIEVIVQEAEKFIEAKDAKEGQGWSDDPSELPKAFAEFAAKVREQTLEDAAKRLEVMAKQLRERIAAKSSLEASDDYRYVWAYDNAAAELRKLKGE